MPRNLPSLTRAEAQALGRRRAQPVKAKPRKESELQREILRYLAVVPGVVAWKAGSGLLPLADGRRVRMGKTGVSDIIGWQSGEIVLQPMPPFAIKIIPLSIARFLAIEVKGAGKQPTREQAAFLDSVRKAGGIGILAYSLDDVQKELPTP